MSLTPINASHKRKEVEQPSTSKPTAIQFVQQKISTVPPHVDTQPNWESPHPSQLFRDMPAARTHSSPIETLSYSQYLFAQKCFDEASSELEKILSKDVPIEARWEYHALRGDCFAALKKNTEAKEEYNAALLFEQNPEKVASTRFKINMLANQALKNGNTRAALDERQSDKQLTSPVVRFDETTATLGFEDEKQTAIINLETGEVIETKDCGKFNLPLDQTALLTEEPNNSQPLPPWASRPFKRSVNPGLTTSVIPDYDSKQAKLPENVDHAQSAKENLLAIAFLSDEAKRCATENLKQGQSLLNTGKLDEAIECFLEGIKFASVIKAPDLSLQLCHNLGFAFYRKNNIPKCILVWKMTLPFLDNDDKKLQLCTSLLGIARKSNNFDLFKGIETIGLGITKATNETKTGFLFECGQMLEAKASFLFTLGQKLEAKKFNSDAMEIYQSLLAQAASEETKQELLAKLASLQNK